MSIIELTRVDGDAIAINADRVVRIWERTDRTMIKLLDGYTEQVRESVAVIAERSRAATANRSRDRPTHERTPTKEKQRISKSSQRCLLFFRQGQSQADNLNRKPAINPNPN